MKNERDNKLTILFIWLILTSLLLVSSTYAWFTTNQIFKIDSFDIHVATKGDIEISTDAINYKGVVGMLDFINANDTYKTNVNQMPIYMKPTSSAGDVENGYLKMFEGFSSFTNKDYELTASRVIEEKSILEEDSNASFMAFDVFIKTNTPKTLMLAKESSITYVDEKNSGIANAFRLAFINEGVGRVDSINYNQNLNKGTKAVIWEVNYDSHNKTAIDHAKNIYKINVSNNDSRLIEYDGVKANIPENSNVKVQNANARSYPEYFKRVNPNIITKSINNEDHYLMNIEAGVTKLRVYVWLEGQDIDCEDNSAFGKLSINLQFKAN